MNPRSDASVPEVGLQTTTSINLNNKQMVNMPNIRTFAGQPQIGVSKCLAVPIGDLTACVIAGYPGSVASVWQQSGRAGRRSGESLTVMVGRSLALSIPCRSANR